VNIRVAVICLYQDGFTNPEGEEEGLPPEEYAYDDDEQEEY